MNREAKVVRILDNFAKHGVSQKNGKDWSQSRVELDNGESIFIFNPIAEGDMVEERPNGEYMNWYKKKVDPKHDEIMQALRRIYATQKAILTAIKGEDDTSTDLEPKDDPTPSTTSRSLREIYMEKKAQKNDEPFDLPDGW